MRLASDNTFSAVFEQWLAHRSIVLPDVRQSTLSQIRRGFDNDVLPLLRSLSIYDVTRGHLLEVIQRIEARKSYSVAEKVRTWFAQMFRFARVVTPDLEKNPATDLDVVAVPLPPVEHNPFLRMAQLPTKRRQAHHASQPRCCQQRLVADHPRRDRSAARRARSECPGPAVGLESRTDECAGKGPAAAGTLLAGKKEPNELAIQAVVQESATLAPRFGRTDLPDSSRPRTTAASSCIRRGP
ncbi:tyrosine-type recombinase/integrase [Serratia marcescens]|uniref:tyrosine-type recombinase/integrase n=1 Tax=Serratia marcescens TaxID=615 RepID=UPI0040274C58